METPEKLYRRAQSMILRVLNDDGRELSLAHDGFNQLLYLPPEISQLKHVHFLDLSGSKIKDISSVAAMTGLRNLKLGSSSVECISPLSQLTNLERLDLSDTIVSDLTPLESCTTLREVNASGTNVRSIQALSKLTDLRILRLSGSLLENISPLGELSRLEYLNISKTPVADLRPIRHLAKNLIQKGLTEQRMVDSKVKRAVSQALQADAPRFGSLFQDLELKNFGFDYSLTEATALDPMLARLSKSGSRAIVETLDYLSSLDDDWPPISVDAPKQDTIFPVSFKDRKIELELSGRKEDQELDAIQAAVLPKLKDLCLELEQVSGNQFYRLNHAARNLSKTLYSTDGLPDAVLVHIEVEAIRALIESRNGLEEDEQYSSDVSGVAAQVLALGPSLTMGDPNVLEIENRISAFRSAEVRSQAAASREMIAAVSSSIDTFGEDLKGVSQTLSHAAELGSSRLISGGMSLSRNILVVIGAVAAANIATGAMGHLGVRSIDFLLENPGAVKAVAHYYGGSFQAWILAIMQHLPEIRNFPKTTKTN